LARQLNTKLTGTKSGLSFYKMYDTFYVRTKSQGGKQTQRTKARQQDFAIAASLSKNIRLMLHATIPNPKQKTMQNRLTKALLQWQLSRVVQETNPAVIQQLNNFQFIKETPLQTILNIPVTIDKTPGEGLQIIIPAFKPKQSLKAPEQTKQICINIAAGRCSYTQLNQTESTHKQIIITYNNKPVKQQIIQLPLNPTEQSITVVAISFSYWVIQQNYSGLLRVKQKAWSPAAIIWATEG
jgi:hypothetical protein